MLVKAMTIIELIDQVITEHDTYNVTYGLDMCKGEIKVMPRERYYTDESIDGKRNRGRPKLR